MSFRAEHLTLIIDKAQPLDAGVYVCVAENIAGSAEARLDLRVSKPPSIEKHPNSLHLEEGKMAFFECRYKVNASFPPKNEWYINFCII